MNEAEFITEVKRTTHHNGRPASRRPLTITVMDQNGFTVLYETTPEAIATDFTDIKEELHVYDENMGDMKQLATAISTNPDCYFVLSKETQNGSVQLTYITPSFIVNKKNNIHLLRGHQSKVNVVINETEQ